MTFDWTNKDKLRAGNELASEKVRNEKFWLKFTS